MGSRTVGRGTLSSLCQVYDDSTAAAPFKFVLDDNWLRTDAGMSDCPHADAGSNTKIKPGSPLPAAAQAIVGAAGPRFAVAASSLL